MPNNIEYSFSPFRHEELIRTSEIQQFPYTAMNENLLHDTGSNDSAYASLHQGYSLHTTVDKVQSVIADDAC